MLHRTLVFVLGCVLVGMIVLGTHPTGPVQASAYVDTVVETCSSFQAEGASDAPYVILYVKVYVTGEPTYWTSVAVSGGHYSGALNFPEADAGTLIRYSVWGALSPSPSGSQHDGGDHWYEFADCVPKPKEDKDEEPGPEKAPIPGPPIPDGFELYLFTCDTELFATPAGQAVPDALITAGQSWYIDPVGVEDEDGAMWHQVFVGSYDHPYIPAECIAGQ